MFRTNLIPLVSLLLTATAAAQQVVSARAGLIYYTEGAVFFDGAPAGDLVGTRYPTLDDGQLISTERGHAEILLGAGAVLWTGLNSKIRMENTGLDDTRIRIEAGTGIVEVRRIPEENRIRVSLGDSVLLLTRAGLYRFDAEPLDANAARVRVYDGELMTAGSQRVRPGQQASLSANQPASSFDRGYPDEFHYWAAWRSYQLGRESSFTDSAWDRQGLYQESMRHSGFEIEFPLTQNSARLQYLTAASGALVYYLKGGAILGGPDMPNQARVPFRLTSENTLSTEAGSRAEIFLGVGVVARLEENAKIRISDATPMGSTLTLYQGRALIEVANTAGDLRIRVMVGTAVAELLKSGLYEFDADAGVLRVHGGEAETIGAGKRNKSRRGQMLTLGATPKASRFDRNEKSLLYQWGYERSLFLARSNGSFMTQWERVGRLLRHPQYGSVEGPGGRGRGR